MLTVLHAVDGSIPMYASKTDVITDATPQGGGLLCVTIAALALLLWPISIEACWLVDRNSVVVNETKTVDCVYVMADKKLVIGSSGTLVLDGESNDPNDPNDPSSVSTINGTITMEDETAILRITSNDHTFQSAGSGTLIGEDGGAKIEIGNGQTLTNEITIQGCLRIVRAQGASNTTFINNGTVSANAGCTLEVYTNYLDDQDDVAEESGNWSVSGNSNAELWLRVGSDELTGDFAISAGTLDVDASIITTGDLSFTSGTIEVYQGKTFQAGQ